MIPLPAAQAIVQDPSPEPIKPPDEQPVEGPKGPRTPYPVDRPGISDLPGSAPDVIPGSPAEPPGKM